MYGLSYPNLISAFSIKPAAVDGRRSRVAYDPAPLPEYDAPPVSEVALSISFAPLASWRAVHGGIFWRGVKADYPRAEAHTPLAPQVESFEADLVQPPTLTFGVPDLDTSRFWFLSESGTDLVQVQRDRFVVNWRKVTGDEIYPRYQAEMRPRLAREWDRFARFVEDEQVGELTVTQCEMTYVNDIPRGEGWETYSDSLKLFSIWSGKSTDGFLRIPESLSVMGSFLMPMEHRGRLHFATQNLKRHKDQVDVVQLRLTARGDPQASDVDGILRWMDIAREWIVRGFTDLTSPEAHKLWKRTR